MSVGISRDALAAMWAAAEADPAREVCGLLFGTPDQVERAVPCANVADDPARRFEIDPKTLLAAYRAERQGGPAIIGCYHSHPNGTPEPSACDAEMAAPDGALWIILAGPGLGAWRAVKNGALHGRFDAVAMLHD